METQSRSLKVIVGPLEVEVDCQGGYYQAAFKALEAWEALGGCVGRVWEGDNKDYPRWTLGPHTVFPPLLKPVEKAELCVIETTQEISYEALKRALAVHGFIFSNHVLTFACAAKHLYDLQQTSGKEIIDLGSGWWWEGCHKSGNGGHLVITHKGQYPQGKIWLEVKPLNCIKKFPKGIRFIIRKIPKE